MNGFVATCIRAAIAGAAGALGANVTAPDGAVVTLLAAAICGVIAKGAVVLLQHAWLAWHAPDRKL